MLNEEMKANIDAYNERIETIEDFVKAVRQMPGMYIGAIHNAGFLNIIREIVQNALDQLLDPSSPCDRVKLVYDERTFVTIVEDNGLGIPFDGMVRIYTKEHTSKNYTKKPYEYSSGLHGVGAKVTNALSDWFIVESYRYDGEARRLEMKDGYPVSKDPQKIPNKDKHQGTKVTFHPSHDALGEVNLTYETVYHLFKLIMSLTPLGSTMDFTGIDKAGKEHHEMIVNKDGILTDLILKTNKPLCVPIVYGEDNGTMKCDFAMVYDIESLSEDMDITAFSNMCPTTEGTHIDGFIDGVTKWFTAYMNKIFLGGNNSKLKVKAADIKTGLNVMLSTAHLYPVFDGQAKGKLSNEEMKPYVSEVVCRGLDAWSKANPGDVKKICTYIKSQAQLRVKMEEGKQKISKSYNVSSFTGLPKKYDPPTGTSGCEFWMVEGDSAGGTAKTAKCNEKQGVLPLRGKIPNAFEKSKSDILSNVECRAIIDITGGGKHDHNYGKEFDIELVKKKWDKIVASPDADIDGSHINALILSLYIVYMPQVFEAGLYYKAVAPLYSINKGGKYQYFVDRMDMLRHFQKIFLKNNTVLDIERKPLNGAKLSAIFLEFADYQWEVERFANTYKIDPELLDIVLELHMQKKKPADIAKTVAKIPKFRYIKHIKMQGVDTIQGLVGVKYNTIYLYNMFIQESANVIKYMKDPYKLTYYLNGEKISIYKLMREFNKLLDGTITRMKGLGEMDAKQFKEAVMDPYGGKRTLIQYTVDDVKAEIATIRSYQSDKSKILDHIGNISRIDVMD